MNSKYIEFFLNSKADIIQYECIEISHNAFSQTYRLVRNNTLGLTATLETAEQVTFDYCPMAISRNSQQDNLDFGIDIEIGDVGEILQLELDAIQISDDFITKPLLKYRTFRSDDLTEPMYGPLSLNVENLAFNKTGSVIEAKAPFLSLTQTGLVFTLDKFPTLRSFI